MLDKVLKGKPIDKEDIDGLTKLRIDLMTHYQRACETHRAATFNTPETIEKIIHTRLDFLALKWCTEKNKSYRDTTKPQFEIFLDFLYEQNKILKDLKCIFGTPSSKEKKAKIYSIGAEDEDEDEYFSRLRDNPSLHRKLGETEQANINRNDDPVQIAATEGHLQDTANDWTQVDNRSCSGESNYSDDTQATRGFFNNYGGNGNREYNNHQGRDYYRSQNNNANNRSDYVTNKTFRNSNPQFVTGGATNSSPNLMGITDMDQYNPQGDFLWHCPCCNGHKLHTLGNCDEFFYMDVEERRQATLAFGRCWNCLRQGHKAFECPEDSQCEFCSRKHHSLLHVRNKHAQITQLQGIG